MTEWRKGGMGCSCEERKIANMCMTGQRESKWRTRKLVVE